MAFRGRFSREIPGVFEVEVTEQWGFMIQDAGWQAGQNWAAGWHSIFDP